jgi:hypothetical protein
MVPGTASGLPRQSAPESTAWREFMESRHSSRLLTKSARIVNRPSETGESRRCFCGSLEA